MPGGAHASRHGQNRIANGWQESDHTQALPFGSLASALKKKGKKKRKEKRKLVEEEVVKNMEFGFSWPQLSRDNGESAWRCEYVHVCLGMQAHV